MKIKCEGVWLWLKGTTKQRGEFRCQGKGDQRVKGNLWGGGKEVGVGEEGSRRRVEKKGREEVKLIRMCLLVNHLEGLAGASSWGTEAGRTGAKRDLDFERGGARKSGGGGMWEE